MSKFNNTICSRHDIAEILLKLTLNINQSKTGAPYFTNIEENSTLSVHELVLTLNNISLDAKQILKYEQVFLDNEDKLDDFTHLFDFMQQCNKMIE